MNNATLELHTQFYSEDENLTVSIYTDDELTKMSFWMRAGIAALEIADLESMKTLIDVLQAAYEEANNLISKGEIHA